MSTQEAPAPHRRPGDRQIARVAVDNSSREVCAVCGVAVEPKGIEDTNGWRWFNDGHGGLLPLCPNCPPPRPLLADTQ